MPHGLPSFFNRLRFATAAMATAVLNLNVAGLSLKKICSPGFNCHGCPWATFACPVGVMAYGSAMHRIPVYAIASVLAVGAVVGRLVCGFACPFGLLQDLLHRIPGPKIRLPRFFRYGKYLTLALLVFLLPWALGFEVSQFMAIDQRTVNKGQGGNLDVDVTVTNHSTEPLKGPLLDVTYIAQNARQEVHRERKQFADVIIGPGETMKLPQFQVLNRLSSADLVIESPQSEIRQEAKYQLYYCKLCPNGTLTATVPSLFRASTTPMYRRAAGVALRMGILAIFLALMWISSRPVCRLFCPLGAIYAMTAKLSLVGMKLNHDACIECGRCDKACPMELDVTREIGGMECIACGDCKKVCPQGGISRTFALLPEKSRLAKGAAVGTTTP